jgi:hypothetical protein
MPYKIEGTTNTNGELVILDESNWTVEKTLDIDSSQAYSANALASGIKTVFAKTPEGEVVGYGNVEAIPGALYDRELGSSLQLDDADSAYLHRTNGAPTDSKKCIISLWKKRSDMGYSCMLGERIDSNNRFGFFFDVSPQKISIIQLESGVQEIGITATPYYRDPTAWMHLCLAIDTTQSTEADRVKLFVNGVEAPYQTYTCTQNVDVRFLLSGVSQEVGRGPQNGGTIDYADGYMTEVICLDGQTHADPPSLFGELVNGVWVP